MVPGRAKPGLKILSVPGIRPVPSLFPPPFPDTLPGVVCCSCPLQGMCSFFPPQETTALALIPARQCRSSPALLRYRPGYRARPACQLPDVTARATPAPARRISTLAPGPVPPLAAPLPALPEADVSFLPAPFRA